MFSQQRLPIMAVHLTSPCKVMHCHVRWPHAARSDCLQLLFLKTPFVTCARQSSYHISYPYHLKAIQSRTGAKSFQSWRQLHLQARTFRFPNTLPPDVRNQSAHLKRSSIVAAGTPLLLACCYSRLLRNAAEKSKKPSRGIKVKDFLLIDEDGSNLGVMPRNTALQLAESKGLEVVQVRKETPGEKAVCKLVSRKQIWDQEKRQKQARKDPRNVTKEVTISTNIAEHDLAVKVNQMKGFLEKLHNVRVSIDPQVRRGELVPGERKRQKELMEGAVQELKGVGKQVVPEHLKRFKLECTLKSLL